ncbi:hypothetical protein [Thermoactinospora rubra]|uniref:hypothetical protein n=1 Tax=Thermoactinospora rubra TaxID=1088767 RepID=UPI000A1154B9|nr:hypothetical protein [Thermoactinospora rubra]
MDTYLLDIVIYDEYGIKALPPTLHIEKVKRVGGRPTVMIRGQRPGICVFIMDITPASRVEAGVTAGADTRRACGLSRKMADLAAPELPQADPRQAPPTTRTGQVTS